jgi:anti-sigma B factor antagonist
MAAKPQMAISQQGSVVIGSFLQKKYLQVTPELYTDLGLLAAKPSGAVILDWGRVEYLSSQYLGLLVRLKRVLERRKVRLIFCGLAPEIREVFGITKLDRFFEVLDSLEASLAVTTLQPTVAPPAEPAPCAFCSWPRQGQCKVCEKGVCDKHGHVWGTRCPEHKWKGWLRAFVGS